MYIGTYSGMEKVDIQTNKHIHIYWERERERERERGDYNELDRHNANR